MKFSHVSLVARDRDRLADFYTAVFECEDRVERWTMSGEQVSKGNGVANSKIYAAWLSLPGADDQFLEVLQYENFEDRPTPAVNQPGLGHLCFEVEDIHATSAAILAAGGAPLGEVTDLGTPQSPVLCVYLRDPEGNVLELEQR
ncbi:VOC family protein [Denitrobaculum tricleocarpae]|uniref:VOC family protein n=1 Tax=Denitrobaculum tricleocarpae TaxID=2591009 RepID=A0A545U2Y9_9PROT|nr:VOC family protein [Denitrobaculum tricleocarpae]TQV83818.1 VOC family protein [Denitrobaculum tricleocarpae]